MKKFKNLPNIMAKNVLQQKEPLKTLNNIDEFVVTLIDKANSNAACKRLFALVLMKCLV